MKQETPVIRFIFFLIFLYFIVVMNVRRPKSPASGSSQLTSNVSKAFCFREEGLSSSQYLFSLVIPTLTDPSFCL